MSRDDESLVVATLGVQPAILAGLGACYRLLSPLAVPISQSVSQLTADQASRVRVLVTLGSSETSRSALQALPQLGLIACTGAGYDGIDLAAAKERGIRITHSPGISASSVADLAVGLLIASNRKMFDANATLHARGLLRPWPATDGLTGRRAGIYGLGAIGEKVASRLAACEMHIGYCSRHVRADSPYRHFASILALAEWADALIVCVSATQETVGSIDAGVLAALGREAHLVNVARGAIVDTAALCDALEKQLIAGAGLDVFDPAFLPRLLALPNATVTPHIGGATNQVASAACELVLRNVAVFIRGAELITPI